MGRASTRAAEGIPVVKQTAGGEHTPLTTTQQQDDKGEHSSDAGEEWYEAEAFSSVHDLVHHAILSQSANGSASLRQIYETCKEKGRIAYKRSGGSRLITSNEHWKSQIRHALYTSPRFARSAEVEDAWSVSEGHTNEVPSTTTVRICTSPSQPSPTPLQRKLGSSGGGGRPGAKECAGSPSGLRSSTRRSHDPPTSPSSRHSPQPPSSAQRSLSALVSPRRLRFREPGSSVVPQSARPRTSKATSPQLENAPEDLNPAARKGRNNHPARGLQSSWRERERSPSPARRPQSCPAAPAVKQWIQTSSPACDTASPPPRKRKLLSSPSSGSTEREHSDRANRRERMKFARPSGGSSPGGHLPEDDKDSIPTVHTPQPNMRSPPTRVQSLGLGLTVTVPENPLSPSSQITPAQNPSPLSLTPLPRDTSRNRRKPAKVERAAESSSGGGAEWIPFCGVSGSERRAPFNSPLPLPRDRASSAASDANSAKSKSPGREALSKDRVGVHATVQPTSSPLREQRDHPTRHCRSFPQVEESRSRSTSVVKAEPIHDSAAELLLQALAKTSRMPAPIKPDGDEPMSEVVKAKVAAGALFESLHTLQQRRDDGVMDEDEMEAEAAPVSPCTPTTACGFKDAALCVLREHGGAMTAKELAAAAIEGGYLRSDGRTPALTMAASLYMDIKQHPNDSLFVKPDEGTFGLTEWA